VTPSMSIISQITEITIYDHLDGERIVYSRTNGQTLRRLYSVDAVDPDAVEKSTIPGDLSREIERACRESRWMSILKLSERSPALQEAIDRAIVLYELQKTPDDEPPMWHPV